MTEYGVDVKAWYYAPDSQTIFDDMLTYPGGDTCFTLTGSGANEHVGGPCGSTGTVKIYVADPCDTALEWASMQEYLAHDFTIDPVNGKCYVANVDSQSTTRPELNSDWIEVYP